MNDFDAREEAAWFGETDGMLKHDAWMLALEDHPDCADPGHPGCNDCCEEEGDWA